MNTKFFQTGSIKAKFLKLVSNFSKLLKLSLAGSWNVVKKAFCWITKISWLKLLNAIKLIIEIVNETRSLLFYDQTAHFIQVAG